MPPMTPKDIRELKEALQEEDDHDLLIKIHVHQKIQEKTIENHEERIRENEKWRWRTAGVIGIGTTILVAIAIGILKGIGWIG